MRKPHSKRGVLTAFLGVLAIVAGMFVVTAPASAAVSASFTRDAENCNAGTLVLAGASGDTVLDAVISWEQGGLGVSAEYFGTGGSGASWTHYYDVGAQNKVFPEGAFTMRVLAFLDDGETVVDQNVQVSACDSQPPADIEVTAPKPDFTDNGDGTGKIVIPNVDGVQYFINGSPEDSGEYTKTGSGQVTAEAEKSYKLVDYTGPWSYDFTKQTPEYYDGVWGGNGSENLPCLYGGHWVLTGPDITKATIVVGTESGSMEQRGNQGSWYFDSTKPVNTDTVVTYRYWGGEPSYKLKLSHCVEGSTPTPTPTPSETVMPAPTPSQSPTSPSPSFGGDAGVGDNSGSMPPWSLMLTALGAFLVLAGFGSMLRSSRS